MEHYNIYGELCQGYYCSNCGKSASMMGHRNEGGSVNSFGRFICKPNPEKVRLLGLANPAPPAKPHFIKRPNAD